MKLRFSPEALNDLSEIKQYVGKDLGSPVATGKIISGILASCSLLKNQPKLGMELSKRTGRETDYRYLISGSYIVFYRIESNSISLYRVIDAWIDYIRTIDLAQQP